MKFELQRDEVNTGTGEKGTVCEPYMRAMSSP
jgi:hypothetical protein